MGIGVEWEMEWQRQWEMEWNGQWAVGNGKWEMYSRNRHHTAQLGFFVILASVTSPIRYIIILHRFDGLRWIGWIGWMDWMGGWIGWMDGLDGVDLWMVYST